MAVKVFDFKYFSLRREKAGMKLSTDAVLLGAWTADLLKNRNPAKILDIGTGTGVLALIMAQFFPKAFVDAVDLDDGAVHDASVNFSQSSFSDRLNLIKADISDFRRDVSKNGGSAYDLIICNPPYFNFSATLSDESRKNARCNDSLTAGDLFLAVSGLLSDDGSACIIIPAEQEDNYVRTAKNHGLVPADRVRVSSKKDKAPYVVLLHLKKELSRTADEHAGRCHLLEDDGSRSSYFRNLTAELYLR